MSTGPAAPPPATGGSSEASFEAEMAQIQQESAEQTAVEMQTNLAISRNNAAAQSTADIH